jgi:hypothetical protein
MVRLYARAACEKLDVIFEEIRNRPQKKASLDAEFGSSAKGALDFFFTE